MKIRLSKTLVAVATSAVLLTAVPVVGIAESASASVPTYIVGFEGPMTGGEAALGTAAIYGMDLAITVANATLNLPFNVTTINPSSPQANTVYDDQCSG